MSADDTTTVEEPDAAEPAAPADEARAALLDAFTSALGDAVVGSHVAPGHTLWVRVTREAWREAAAVAKAQGCTFFDFLSAIDWMPSPYGRYEDATVDVGKPSPTAAADIATGYAGGDERFQVFSHLIDARDRRFGVVLKADLPADDLRVDSIVSLYAGASWHERECWEMFGITFDGHPGLRHLYLPGEFEGHPLRKDFPLLARLVKPWPGIVDVEPMPGEPAGDDEATDDSAEGGDA